MRTVIRLRYGLCAVLVLLIHPLSAGRGCKRNKAAPRSRAWHKVRPTEGPAMQLWPATIASPPHEAYAHSVCNYRVSPQRTTTFVARGRRIRTRLLASGGIGCAFFVGMA